MCWPSCTPCAAHSTAVSRAEGAIVGAASGPLGARRTSINAQKVCSAKPWAFMHLALHAMA